MRRHPVTNAEYLRFLNALVAQGDEAAALRHAPQEMLGSGAGRLIYARTPEGRFALGSDASGDAWHADEPVLLVDWLAASAFCQWQGPGWRLPTEAEWEKAARGVDGRPLPWGDAFDPSFCCMVQSHSRRPRPASVSAFPVDESPYGVRGLAGNAREWCLGVADPDGRLPEQPIDVAVVQDGAPLDALRPTRGGAFVSMPPHVRAARRSAARATARVETLGLRAVRPW